MLQNILINLNILSKIKPYDKFYIDNNNLITIEYNNFFQGLFRFLYNNGREKNINNLTNFYNTVFDLIDDILISPKLQLINIDDLENDEFIKINTNINKIYFYLSSSMDGLNNLRTTYHNDIVSDSKLEIIIKNIESYLIKMKKKIEIIELTINNNKEKLL